MGDLLGIEIGSSKIKLLEVTKRKNQMEVKQFDLIDTPLSCLKAGAIVNEALLRKVIQEVLLEKGYKAKKVVMVVEESQMIMRKITMKKCPEKRVRELLELHADHYLPIEKGKYQIDFRLLDDAHQGSDNELIVVAVPNQIILPIMSLVKALKKVPILMTTPSEALGYMFGKTSKMVYEVARELLVIDIGSKSSVVTIIRDQTLELSRVIQFGITQLQAYLEASITFDEVSSHHETISVVRDMHDQLRNNMFVELERILQFYYTTINGEAIKKIYLIGGGAYLKGVREYVEETFDIPTEILKHFNMVTDDAMGTFESYRHFYVNILGALASI